MFHKQSAVRLPAIFLLALMLGACGVKPQMAEEDGGIDFERSSEFQGPWLRVYLDLKDGREVSVNTEDDAVSTGAEQSPLPGHQARWWRFVQEEPEGTSYVYALVSWDGNDPADYLMAGWWAHFDGERPPDLSYGNLEEYAILDGPEIDPAAPPDLPVAGTASYAGPAGGIYLFVPGETLEEQHYVVDGWEATATLTADFGSGTVGGCVGCVGDFAMRAAVIPASRGDVQADISDYELHLLSHSWRENGTFDSAMAEVRSRDRDSGCRPWPHHPGSHPVGARTGPPPLVAGRPGRLCAGRCRYLQTLAIAWHRHSAWTIRRHGSQGPGNGFGQEHKNSNRRNRGTMRQDMQGAGSGRVTSARASVDIRLWMAYDLHCQSGSYGQIPDSHLPFAACHFDHNDSRKPGGLENNP